MAEFLRVTQPIVNRAMNVTAQGKPLQNPTVPFQIIDTSKVQSMSTGKQMSEQNQTLILDADQPSILSQMLQDPSATVHFLRTIYLLQEVIGMMPMIDSPVSKEIEELFNNLLLHPDDIVGEMIKQEQSSTLFKGELFDNLRNMIDEMVKFDVHNLKEALNEGKNSGFLSNLFTSNEQVTNKTAENLMHNMQSGELPPEVTYAIKEMGATNYEGQIKNDIARLLKNMNGVASRRDILTSIGNNLTYLSTALAPHKALAEQLRNLAEWFKYPNEEFNFTKLKQLVAECTTQAEKSVLYNEKVAKNISILQYNFSRFMETTEGLEKATENMFKYLLDEKDMIEFRDMVYKEVIAMSNKEGKESTSKVMTTLCKLIEKQVENSTLTNLNSEKIEKIVYSLLSSPTNFTPLLHYVIPVEYMNMRAFAEVWVDPLCEGDEDENGNKGSKSDLTQVLVAFDIDRLGRFETEIMINKNKMSAYVYVPNDYYEVFKDMSYDVIQAIAKTSYTFDKVEVRPLAAPRSLMEVFKTLPIRRTGINVTV
ncbi:MAG: hypothetical protein IKM20_00305 [Erysipelotrichales bacterium]|nr:hypothetical protein [Erysipelotrichales bacterium]